MNVLVLGDEHSYGQGLAVGQVSYVSHFVRQVSRTGQPITVESYVNLSLKQTLDTLSTLRLNRYDLIIIQVNYSNGCASPWKTAPKTATSMLKRLFQSQRYVSRLLPLLFDTLRPYRHNVVLMTPLPCRQPVEKWFRRRVCARLLRLGHRQLFSVLDTSDVILPREEYFQFANPLLLNAVGHELLGRALFDYYQSAPTIITIQTSRGDF